MLSLVKYLKHIYHSPMQTPHRKPGKWTNFKQDPMMTQEKFDELKNKLERLKTVSRPQAAAEVSRLAELGDFSENVEYQMAKGRLRGINNSILTTENQLRQAVIIAPQKKSDTVQIGTIVTVACNNEQKTYQILGSLETDPSQGVISHVSPIGAALLGRAVGETVTVTLAHKEMTCRIVEII